MVLDLETMERFDPMMLQAAQQIAAQANGEDAINLMAGPSRMRPPLLGSISSADIARSAVRYTLARACSCATRGK